MTAVVIVHVLFSYVLTSFVFIYDSFVLHKCRLKTFHFATFSNNCINFNIAIVRQCIYIYIYIDIYAYIVHLYKLVRVFVYFVCV